MIPKTIHYCWFGKNRKPLIFERCLESWKRHCPQFEIKEWNETNSKRFSNTFYKNALRKKQYAFAADYVRTKVLYNEGGIYLDTDMLVVKSLDPLLGYDFVIGEEVPGRINFAFFAARAGHPLLKKMLDFYDNTPFNPFSPPVISHTFSPLITQEEMGDRDRIFEYDYFYALPYQNKEDDLSKFVTENSYAVHLWDHSWSEAKLVTKTVLLKNLWTVTVDYLFYGYPYAHFKRYFREFARKLLQ